MGQTKSRFHMDVSPFNLQRWQDICRKRLTYTNLKSWGFITKSDGSCSSSNCSSCQRNKEQPVESMVTSAIDNLLSVIGETGFQCAVQDLESENYTTAVSHLKLGTRCQNPSATYNLGLCFELGIGVRQEFSMARQCFYLASNLGHPKAMYNLGVYYAHGLGGLRKSRKMTKLCLIAAAILDEKEAIAQLELRYPQIVQQLNELEERVEPNYTIWIESICAVMFLFKLQFIYIVTETIQIRIAKRTFNGMYNGTIKYKRKCRSIFQPRKLSGGLKYKIKTRLLEGQ